MYSDNSSPTIINSNFTNNSSGEFGYGGGMYSDNSSPTIINSNFTNNSAGKYGDGAGIYSRISNISIQNTVFYNNTDYGVTNDIYLYSSTLTGSNNASDGVNAPADTGTLITLTADPFTDSTTPAGADGIYGTSDDGLVPAIGSVLINAGDNTHNSTTLDLAGNTRVFDVFIDIGAYESQTTVITNPDSAIITQVYHSGTDEKWIEITNSSASIIPANTIKLALYQNKTGDQTGVTPDVEYTITTAIAVGETILIRKNISAILPHIGTPIENTSITDFDGADDIIIITGTTGANAWANRFDVVNDIANEASYVRNDDITTYNNTYTATEWTYFSNDLTDRLATAPLLTEIASADNTSNTKLGTHSFGATTYTTAAWDNGEPDVSRSIVIDDDYERTGTNFILNKLTINTPYKVTINNVGLIIANNLTINSGAELRLAGTAQLVQTHTGNSLVSGTGKLLVDQNATTNDTYRYNYLSSPVNSVGSTTFTVADVMKNGSTPTSSSSTPLDITFTSGNDGAVGASSISIAEKWIYTYTSDVVGYEQKLATGLINQTDGFTFKGPGQIQNYTFVGTPKDGDMSTATPISTNGNYLLGNPYPSAINAKKFIKDNESVIDGTLYFWEHVGTANGHYTDGYIGGYATLTKDMGLSADNVTSNNINSGNGIPYIGTGTYQTPKNYIPVGQGFFVTSSTNSGTINFNNSQREYITEGASSVFFKTSKQNATYKTTDSDTKAILKLGIDYVNDDGLKLHRQLGAVFSKDYSFDYEPGHDAVSYNENNTEIYWEFPNDDRHYIITGVPEINTDLQVPLTIKTGSNSSFALTIDEWQNIDQEIYLLDKETNTTQTLESGTAILNLKANTLYADRFAVVFTEHNGTNNILEGSIDAISVVYNNDENTVTAINLNNIIINSLELYSLSGKLIGKSNNKIIHLGNTETLLGVFIVRIETNKGTVIKKVLMN